MSLLWGGKLKLARLITCTFSLILFMSVELYARTYAVRVYQPNASTYNFVSGSNYSSIRNELTSVANFGAGGIVSDADFSISAASAINTTELGNADIFIAFYSSEAASTMTASEAQMLKDFVDSGKSLIFVGDYTANSYNSGNALGNKFGGLTFNAGSVNTSGTATITNTTYAPEITGAQAPFGSVASISWSSNNVSKITAGGDTVILDNFGFISLIKPTGSKGAVIFYNDAYEFGYNSQGEVALVKNLFAYSARAVKFKGSATGTTTTLSGDWTINAGGVQTINYDRSTVVELDNAGATAIKVHNGSLFATDSEIVIIEMNGSSIGKYEFNKVTSVSGNVLNLQNPLANNYDSYAQVIEIGSYNNLTITNTTTVTCPDWNGTHGGVLVFKAVNLTIDQNSSIDVTGKGFLPNDGFGVGKGTTTSYGGAGGAYGGEGANGNGPVLGGTAYGLFNTPVCMGSGGGTNVYSGYKAGGDGGGIVLIQLSGNAVINGSIKSNGASSIDTTTYNGGGGSGGSILIISAGTVSGTNTTTSYIESNGGPNGGTSGNSSFFGGGGGGGRIAVVTPDTSYTYQGITRALGGLGYNGVYGGAGTVYIKNGTDETLKISNASVNCDETIINHDGTGVSLDTMLVDTAKLTYTKFATLGVLDIRSCDATLAPSFVANIDSISYGVPVGGSRTFNIGANVNVNNVTITGLNSSNRANFNINTGANILNSVNLNGYTTVTNNIVMASPLLTYLNNNDNDITNSAGAKIRFNNLSLGTNSALINNGTLEIYANQFTIGNGSSYDGTGSFLTGDIDNNLTVESGGTFTSSVSSTMYFNDVWLKTGSSMTHTANSSTEAFKLNFQCTGNFTVETGATINLAGKGYGATYGTGAGGNGSTTNYYVCIDNWYYAYPSGGGGATHGGNGSSGYSSVGSSNYYDSVVNPVNIGSGGGHGYMSYHGSYYCGYFSITQYSGGAGGGAFIANVGGTFILNGTINANGLDASGGTYYGTRSGGGGAGGTINIQANMFSCTNGSSVISANGGNRYGTNSDGGGGGGGRVSIRASNSYSSAVTPTAYGGDGYNGQYGGAGTVYVKIGTLEYVYVKNPSASSSSASFAQTNITNAADAGNFTNVQLYDIAYSLVNITNLLGGVCNQMTVMDSEVNVALNTKCSVNTLDITVPSTSGATRKTSFTTNYNLDINNSTMIGKNDSIQARLDLPQKATVTGQLSLNNYASLYNYGVITSLVKTATGNDIYNYLGGAITAPSLTLGSGEYFHQAGALAVSDTNLTLNNNATMNFEQETPMNFGNITIGSSATISQTASTTSKTYKLHFICSGNFNNAGTIQMNNFGYPNDLGPGKGSSTAVSGNGAGGGAYGGDGTDGINLANSGGNRYESISNPLLPGSGGGSNNYGTQSRGGFGGGALIVEAYSGTITAGGNIYANGEAAPSGGSTNNGGGGSGGCINLRGNTIAGTGNLYVRGGAKISNGGGGGGGKIAMVCNSYNFSGNTYLEGGLGYNSIYGGSGTLYIQYGVNKQLYIKGNTSYQTRELTQIKDNDTADLLNLTLLSTESSNVNILRLSGCTQCSITNTDIDFTSILQPLSITNLDILVNSTSTLSRRTKVGDKITVANTTVDGYSTSYQGVLEARAGSQFTTSFQQKGNSLVENYTTINLPSTYTFFAGSTDNDINNYASGSITLPTFDISSSSYVKNYGTISPVDTNLTIRSGGTYDIAKSSVENYTTIDVQSGGLLTQTQDVANNYKIQLSCSNMTVAGTVDATGKGYLATQGAGAGASVASNSQGAGGGAYGGDGSDGYASPTPNAGGAGYGSITNPSDYGSGGGSLQSYAGSAGGGIINLNVTNTLNVTGTIKSNGATVPSGSNPYCGGGGAGGSIKITAGTFAGSGTLQVMGGDNYSNGWYGGGGGGGRIAVYCATKSYSGTPNMSGGRGSSSLSKNFGGAGTLYYEVNGVKSLYINNNTSGVCDKTILPNDANMPTPLSLFSIYAADVTLNKIISVDTLTMQGYNSSVRAILDRLIDGSTVNTQVNLSGYTTFNNYTSINLPNNFSITGTDNIFNNYFTGYVRFASLSLTGGTTITNDGTIEVIDRQLVIGTSSTYVMDHNMPTPDYDLIVNSGGTFRSETADVLYFRHVTVNNGGQMIHIANNNTVQYMLNINCSGNFTLANTGVVDATGAGFAPSANAASNGIGLGAGAGTSNSSYGGGGAGYGGDGSDGYSAVAGGSAFGSLVNPTDLGSSGGNTYSASYKGSSGGGVVLLNVAGTATLNGTIKTNANNVSGVTGNICGGGGSGGAINIRAAVITGTNTSASIESKGGSRVSGYYGGGGAGGRIALVCTTYSYQGTFNTSGGDGYNNIYGGTGTVYIEDSSTKKIILAGYVANNYQKDITPFKDNDTSIPTIITSYTINNSNLSLKKLFTCDTMTVVNSDVNIDTAQQCTINTADIKINVAQNNNRKVTCYPKTRMRTVILTGNGANLHAQIELQSGSKIIDTLDIRGYTDLYNYTAINLPSKTTSPKYVTSGTDNDIINYATGSMVIPEFVISNLSYVVNYNTISPVDTNLTIQTGGTYEIAKNIAENYTNVTVAGTLKHAQNTTALAYKVAMNCTNFTVSSGGVIDLEGRGYAAANGPGKGANSTSGSGAGGASHGGLGVLGFNGSSYVTSSGSAYDSIKDPVELGSGGGTQTTNNYVGGSGGGLITLNVSGTFTNSGSIKVNATDSVTSATSNGGGGSGGTINITTGSYAGNGSFEAKGGFNKNTGYYGGGGSGGRISIKTNTSTAICTYDASGNAGYNAYFAQPGTVYVKVGSLEYLYFENKLTSPSYTNNATQINFDQGSETFNLEQLRVTRAWFKIVNISSVKDAVIQGHNTTFQANFELPAGGINIGNSVTLNGNTILKNYVVIPTLFVNNNDNDIYNYAGATATTPTLNMGTYSSFENYGAFTITDGNLIIGSNSVYTVTGKNQLTFANVTIQSGGLINHLPNTSSELYKINIRCTGNFSNSGTINVDSRGYARPVGAGTNGNGPGGGAGSTTTGGDGAGHAGYGSDAYNSAVTLGGMYYGSIYDPVDLGSSGGNSNTRQGGAGGGAVIITADGTFSLNGTITANGENSVTGTTQNGGGGSGGSINITAGTFAGSGTAYVNGGNNVNTGYYGGGGAGGRISIKANTSTFSGNYYAYGNHGYATGNYYGGAGTIYTKFGTTENLRIINQNVSGGYATITPIYEALNITTLTANYATALFGNLSSLTNIVSANSWVYLDPVTTPLVIQSINHTRNMNNQRTLTIRNNVTVNNLTMSGTGGASYKPEVIIEAGGVVNQLTMSGSSDLTNYGTVNLLTKSSDYNNVYNYDTSTMTIDNLNFGTNSYFRYDGNITIQNTSAFTIQSGTTMELDTVNPLTFGAVTINSGGVLTHTYNTNAKNSMVNIVTTGAFTVNSGGVVDVNGRGFAAGYGFGVGTTATYNTRNGGGGGAYGASAGTPNGTKTGGNGYNGVLGGVSYGDEYAPMDLGSGGGSGYYDTNKRDGGSGGGAIKLTVGTTLTANGYIRANGANATSYYNSMSGGGGSGGSIFINANAIAGSLSYAIQANGGTNYGGSSSYWGGGGSGGRIYASFQTSSYTGGMQANGGTGYTGNNGLAGSVITTAYPSSLYPITMTANPSSLQARSSKVTVVTSGQIKDSTNTPVGAGAEITVSISRGSFYNVTDINPNVAGVQVRTSSGSVITFSVMADESVDEGTILVSVASVLGSATGSLTIPIYVGNPTGSLVITPDNDSIIASGITTATITSQPITDNEGNIVHTGYVTVSASAGTITTADANGGIAGRQVAIQANGTISFVLQSSTTVSTATVTATSVASPTVSGSTVVHFIIGPLAKVVAILPGESFSKSSGTGKSGTASNHTAGTAYNVDIYLCDAYYNKITSLNTAVTMSSNQQYSVVGPSSQQSLPGDGVTEKVTFTINEKIAQSNNVLNIGYPANPSLNVSTSAYTVVPASGGSLKMQVLLPGETAQIGLDPGKTGTPADQKYGIPFYIRLNLVDAYYNVITGRSDSITLTSNGVGASLPHPNLSNGTAYVQVTENQLGSGRVITASASGVTSGSSSSFFVYNTIPVFVSVSPSESKPGLTKVLTISGSDFLNGATVNVLGGGVSVTDVSFVNGTRLDITVNVASNAALGAKDITIANPEGSQITASGAFLVRDNDLPSFSSFVMPEGAGLGDSFIIQFLSSENLASNPVVTVDGRAASFQSKSGLTYTYSYNVAGSENTGYVDIIVQGTDYVGNIGYGMAKIIIDFNNPAIINPIIDPLKISPNGDFKNDTGYISFGITDESTYFNVNVLIKSGITLIKTLWNGTIDGKYFSKPWDGKDNYGAGVQDGPYSVDVTVTDPAGNSVTQTIGSIEVDNDADAQPYIVFAKEVQTATIQIGTYNLPISLKNNSTTDTHTLSLFEVINNDNSFIANFSTNPASVSIAPSQSSSATLAVNSSNASYNYTDIQLRLVNEQPNQFDYSYMRVYMSATPKPDLKVTVQDLSFTPSNPALNSNVAISIKVKNTGNLTASNIGMSFISFATQIATHTITSLAPDAETTVTKNVSFNSAGPKVIIVKVDPSNAISELDEYNNQANKILLVGPQQQLDGNIRVALQTPVSVTPDSIINVEGRADYDLLLNGLPNYSYPVAGGSVYLQVKDPDGVVVLSQSGWFTNTYGDFNFSFKLPSSFQPGDYALVKVLVTDHTVLGYAQSPVYIYQKSTPNSSVWIYSFDSDCDGILNMVDGDIDGDGIPNASDVDIDGDGVNNEYDVVVSGPISGDPDIDGDGIPNYFDNDIDGDSTVNSSDATLYGGTSYYGMGTSGGYGSSGGSLVLATSAGGAWGSSFAGGFGGFNIPAGGKIFTQTGESSTGGYHGAVVPLASNSYDAYFHSIDISFSKDNPGLGEPISITATIWANGFGAKQDIPVSFVESYPNRSPIQVGQAQYMTNLGSGTNAQVTTSWKNSAEGIYLIDVKLDQSLGYNDANSVNNITTKAIVVGGVNQLIDVVLSLPVNGAKYLSMKESMEIKFEVWNGFTMLTPSDLDTLVIKFSDSMSLASDIVVVRDGALLKGSFNEANNVYSVVIQAPIPTGGDIDNDGLYPGVVTVLAQVMDSDNDSLNGSSSVDVNLTPGKSPPQVLDSFATSYAIQLTWPQAGSVNKYSVYRSDVSIARLNLLPDNALFSYLDYNVVREQTYGYFVLSVDAQTDKDGIITSPVVNKAVPSRRRR